MDKLINKLKKLKDLKDQRLALDTLLKQKKNSKNLEKLLSKKDWSKLLDFIHSEDLSEKDKERIREIMRIKLTENNIPDVSTVNILVALNENIEDVFRSSLEKATSNIQKLRIMDLMLENENYEDYFYDIHATIENQIHANPKALDKFLNEVVELKNRTPMLLDLYAKLEKIYFQKAVAIIKEDEKNALEDIVYLVHKIQRRNNMVDVSLMDCIKADVSDLHILKREDDYCFFVKMF